MDAATQRAVAKALDTSIARIATSEFKRLADQSGDSETVARKIYEALRSLQRLQHFHDEDRMPNYDEWDAPLYLTWFQPAQINLAYTLIQEVLEDKNLPLRETLQIVDFGCGALAMQFGFALAVAENPAAKGTLTKIAVDASDSSMDMYRVGLNLWHNFVKETSDKVKYPELAALHAVLRAIGPFVRRNASARWLTAFHVAYKKNQRPVADALDQQVEEWKPDVVLVTSRTEAACWAYSLDENSKYEGAEMQTDITGETLKMTHGCFKATSELRERLYEERISDMPDSLFENDKTFAHRYLTLYPTAWCTPSFNAMRRLYVRR